jgi:hypothetical protein
MSDKLQRISNLIDQAGQVEDEKVTDSILDLSVYSLILLIYLQDKYARNLEISHNKTL